MKRILVPIDFSALSGFASDFAMAVSENKKIELIFYHMNENPVLKDILSKKGLKVGVAQERKVLLKLVKFIKKRLPEKGRLKVGRKFKFIVEAGSSAPDQIVAVAKKHKVDLVIMGTKGATGLKRVFLGSVASKTIRKSPVPVIVVPSRQELSGNIQTIYSTDFQNTKKEIKRLRPVQELLGGELEVIHVNSGWALTKKEQKEYNDLKKSGENFFEYKVTTKFPLGVNLRNYIRKKPNSVVALFHERKNFLEKILFKSHTENFAMDMKVPMISLQKN